MVTLLWSRCPLPKAFVANSWLAQLCSQERDAVVRLDDLLAEQGGQSHCALQRANVNGPEPSSSPPVRIPKSVLKLFRCKCMNGRDSAPLPGAFLPPWLIGSMAIAAPCPAKHSAQPMAVPFAGLESWTLAATAFHEPLACPRNCIRHKFYVNPKIMLPFRLP